MVKESSKRNHPKHVGSLDILEEIDYLDVIIIEKQKYLHQARPTLLSGVVKFLTNIDIYFKNLKRKYLIKKLDALCRFQSTNGDYKSLFANLDRYHRYMAFKYSVHYREAKYLINQKRKSDENENVFKKWKNSVNYFLVMLPHYIHCPVPLTNPK